MNPVPSSGTTEILAETRVSATDTEVMRAVLDPAAMGFWLQGIVEFRPQVGALFRLQWEDTPVPSTVSGEVLDVNPARSLVLSWRRGDDEVPTRVSLSVAPESEATMVRLRHSGLPAGHEWTGSRDLLRSDWEKSLANLRFFVEERGELPATILRRSATLAAPAERAYQVWTERDHLTAWWLREAELDTREGGRIRFRLSDGAQVIGEIVLLQKHRHVRWLWTMEGRRTMIGVSFWPFEDGSRLQLTQIGFRCPAEQARRYEELWDSCMRELTAYIG
jgi:uncharacterized protein YndB with AHSA1/START domain